MTQKHNAAKVAKVEKEPESDLKTRLAEVEEDLKKLRQQLHDAGIRLPT